MAQPHRLAGPGAARFLVRVAQWEVQRLAANRWVWIAAPLAFAFFSFVLSHDGPAIWVGNRQTVRNLHIFIPVTTVWGYSFTSVAAVLFIGLLVPFVMTDGVAYDLHARMHELLMTCALPTRAYVWERFAARLGLLLGVALLLLAATMAVGLRFAGTVTPNLPALVGFWSLTAIPAVVLLGGVAFGLGTLWPRRSNVPAQPRAERNGSLERDP